MKLTCYSHVTTAGIVGNGRTRQNLFSTKIITWFVGHLKLKLTEKARVHQQNKTQIRRNKNKKATKLLIASGLFWTTKTGRLTEADHYIPMDGTSIENFLKNCHTLEKPLK